MYQIKFQNGYEIQVIGPGENGPCRVCDSENRVVFRGNYEACEKWLNDRAVSSLMKPKDE